MDAEVFFLQKLAIKPVCLLCGQSVAVLNDKLDVTRGTELDRKLARQQNVFIKGKLDQKASTHASFIALWLTSAAIEVQSVHYDKMISSLSTFWSPFFVKYKVYIKHDLSFYFLH